MNSILQYQMRTRGKEGKIRSNRPAAAIGGELSRVISWNMWSKSNFVTRILRAFN